MRRAIMRHGAASVRDAARPGVAQRRSAAWSCATHRNATRRRHSVTRSAFVALSHVSYKFTVARVVNGNSPEITSKRRERRTDGHPSPPSAAGGSALLARSRSIDPGFIERKCPSAHFVRSDSVCALSLFPGTCHHRGGRPTGRRRLRRGRRRKRRKHGRRRQRSFE